MEVGKYLMLMDIWTQEKLILKDKWNIFMWYMFAIRKEEYSLNVK